MLNLIKNKILRQEKHNYQLLKEPKDDTKRTKKNKNINLSNNKLIKKEYFKLSDYCIHETIKSKKSFDVVEIQNECNFNSSGSKDNKKLQNISCFEVINPFFEYENKCIENTSQKTSNSSFDKTSLLNSKRFPKELQSHMFKALSSPSVLRDKLYSKKQKTKLETNFSDFAIKNVDTQKINAKLLQLKMHIPSQIESVSSTDEQKKDSKSDDKKNKRNSNSKRRKTKKKSRKSTKSGPKYKIYEILKNRRLRKKEKIRVKNAKAAEQMVNFGRLSDIPFNESLSLPPDLLSDEKDIEDQSEKVTKNSVFFLKNDHLLILAVVAAVLNPFMGIPSLTYAIKAKKFDDTEIIRLSRISLFFSVFGVIIAFLVILIASSLYIEAHNSF